MQVRSYSGGPSGEAGGAQPAFGEKILFRTLKANVLQYLANQRQGTASTRGRAEVAGSNKKPWKQKHTGRARAGDRKSPIWRGGGTVFGPKPRDYSYHMPKKARRVALRAALLGKLRDDEVVLCELKGFDQPSSKSARKVLADLGSPRRACVVLVERDENVWKSFRNFPGVKVRTAKELCAYDVANGGTLLVERSAIEDLQERVGIAAGDAQGAAR